MVNLPQKFGPAAVIGTWTGEENLHLQQILQEQIENKLQEIGDSLQQFEAEVTRPVCQAYPTRQEQDSETSIEKQLTSWKSLFKVNTN